MRVQVQMLCNPTARPLVVAFVLAFAAACGNGSPTEPGSPVPEISQIDPGQPTVNSGPQLFSVAGQGFTTGLTVLLTRPDGTRQEITGDAIQGLQSVSFQFSAALDQAGNYLVAVRLVSGTESNAVQITATPAAGSAPRIDVATPSAVQAGSLATVVTLTGANFGAGTSIQLTPPGSAPTTLPASALLGVTSSSLQLSVTFAERGTYGISVTNAQGQASNTVTIEAF